MTTAPEVLQPRVAAALEAEYEIIRPLGQGGMATVFLAREHALKRFVAIKVLEPELAASPVFRVRFRREAEFAASVSHPNIVPIYRVGEVGDLAFYVMAFVDGEHLGERVRREGRLPVREVLRVIRETGSALAAAHRRGLVHRDVKPHNILFEPETGRVLVTDFGIASVVAPAPAGPDDDGSRLTGAGMLMGTPRYMSPEQASGEFDLTPASDFYALGVVGYEMLTGNFPYKLGTTPNFMLAHLTQQPVPPSDRVPGVPAEVEELLQALLAKSALDRVSSGEQLNELLDRADEVVAAATPSPRRASRTIRRRWRLAGGLAAVAAVVALVAMPTIRGERDGGLDPRRSILVGFFENRTGDDELDWLRVGAVEQLAQSLGRWSDMQVVHAERLLDLARRADIEPDAALSQDDARELARLAGVGTAAVGSITRQGADRLRFTVRLYDVRSGKALTEAFVDAPNDSTLPATFALLADRILDISGAPQAARAAQDPPTRSLAAYRAYIEGVGARSRWDLATARAAFGRAVELDPGFALAWYELSVATQPVDAPVASNRFVSLADSAMARAAGRPPTERLLIEAYHALVHADMPKARRLYTELIAIDSTIADAWGGLGDAARLDLTMVRTAAGADSLPADIQLAVRSYQRALALDGTDHRFYASLANTLAKAGLDQDNLVAAYRDPPRGDITTLGARVPASMFSVLALGDTLALVRASEVSRRFDGRQVDSLRIRARARARVVADQWLAIAPDEGQAHLLKAFLQRLDRDFDGALVSLAHAARLGTGSTTSIPLVRASVLLEARRFADAIALVDSLVAVPGYVESVRASTPYLLSVVANARLAGGRIAEAEQYREMAETVFQGRARQVRSPLAPLIDMRLEAARLGIAATYDQVTAQDVRETEARFRRRIEEAPDSIRAPMRQEAAAILSWLAAPVGDTLVMNRWNQWLAPDWEASALTALAHARAGDMRRAAALYQEARADSSRDLSHLVALARTAATLGRGDEALRYYDMVEEHRLLAMRSTDTDWGTIVRTYRERGNIYAARGDVERAREYYGKFLAAWTRPEQSLARELAAVRKALGELTRVDRGDRPG